LKNCWQNQGQTLHEYIRCFSKQCNMLPKIVDADVIGVILSGSTCEYLAHKLGHKGLRTTKELLDIAMSHGSGEEAVGAIFDRAEGKAKQEEAAIEDVANHSGKKKRRGPGGSVVIMIFKAPKTCKLPFILSARKLKI